MQVSCRVTKKPKGPEEVINSLGNQISKYKDITIKNQSRKNQELQKELNNILFKM